VEKRCPKRRTTPEKKWEDKGGGGRASFMGPEGEKEEYARTVGYSLIDWGTSRRAGVYGGNDQRKEER